MWISWRLYEAFAYNSRYEKVLLPLQGDAELHAHAHQRMQPSAAYLERVRFFYLRSLFYGSHYNVYVENPW